MTCEIAVANRLGIALAADSAVTFSTGDGQATYASGANKIFQLATTQPIAAMIYNNADLEKMPWEVLIKEYRRHLAGGSFRTAFEYKDDFITFLNGDFGSLPHGLRERGALASYLKGIRTFLQFARETEPTLYDPTTSEPDLQAAWQRLIAEAKAEMGSLETSHCLDRTEMPAEIARVAADLEEQLRAWVDSELQHWDGVVDYGEVIDLCIEATFKNWRNFLCDHAYTGIVVAGYGSDEFLPSYCSVHVFGFVGSKLLWTNEKCDAVDHFAKASVIQPFAQRAMVETFTQGASPEVWKTVKTSFLDHAVRAATQAAATAGVEIPDEIARQAVVDRLDDFMKGWAFATLDAHMRPLQSVVAGLAVPEIAELAETLVMLESLKEKVTSRTQSVGGPIDVAVITRSEGLVWIKRKHFFEPNLNQRYMVRLQNPK